MLEIPPANDTDAEDVVWGLQTAESLWKRGERIDALVWLRRAAQAAGAANDDDRALELARHAAELSDWMAANGEDVSQAVDDEANTEVSAAAYNIARSLVAQPEPEDEEEPTATVELDGDELIIAESIPPSPAAAPDGGAEDVPVDGERPSVPPADKVHAGMFDPWADTAANAALGRSAPKPAPATALPSLVTPADAADEVVTSVKATTVAEPSSTSVQPPGQPSGPPPPIRVSGKPPPKGPPPLPARARAAKPASLPVPAKAVEPAEPIPVIHVPVIIDAPAPLPPAPVEPLPPQAAEAAPAPETPAVPPVEAAPVAFVPGPPAPPAAETAGLDLEGVESFADLPDDSRAEFARAATLHTLAEGEEVGAFGLAYVVSGPFDVAATVVDAAAVRLQTGSVLRARGTTEEGVPMRLICVVKQGVVATWSDAAVEDAFRTCPWVEEDLRAAADRVQTLVGITIGPLGERMDMSIRELIVSRLTMRSLGPNEIVVEAGAAVPGLMLVGVGELELLKDNKVSGAVGSGEFLFPTEILGAGSAPATARAGAGGALVMFGDRNVAQELLVTWPPLLEVFAGM